MNEAQKKLEAFQKDFSKLVRKYPEIFIGGDINGDLVASVFTGTRTVSKKIEK